MLFIQRIAPLRGALRPARLRAGGRRGLQTLDSNPHVYVFQTSSNEHLLTLLSTEPPAPALAIGTTTALPPSPRTFVSKPRFMPIVHEVLREEAHKDPVVQTSASAFIAASQSSLLHVRHNRRMDQQQTSPPAPSGGFIHISDTRAPVEWARIADPEDIFGSVRVEGDGSVVEGSYDEGGMYRVCTTQGVLGLSDYLRGKVVERLKEEEKKLKG